MTAADFALITDPSGLWTVNATLNLVTFTLLYISGCEIKEMSFARFELYRLPQVRVTDRELGYGSYATVLELDYMGLKCAGKRIHTLLLDQGNASYTIRRFEECKLLSQVHHPNI